METTTIKRYSVAFKQSVVREYEAGASLTGLGRKYGIKGATTIKGWVGRYGRYGTRHKLMVIQKPEEQKRIQELEERISELEKALAQVTLDKLMLSATLEVAEREYGIEVKKSGARPSSRGCTSQGKGCQ